MDYIRKNITLSTKHQKWLEDNSGNHSGTIAESLDLYINHKQTIKTLASRANDIVEALSSTQRYTPTDTGQYEYRELVPGKPKAKVDTQNNTYYDPVVKQWLPVEGTQF